MVMSLKSAFKTIINLQGREMTFTRRITTGNLVETIKAAPSNYFRTISAVEEMTIETNELVIAKDDMGTLTRPERGDRVEDPEYGTQTIATVIEMVAMGEIIGYRIRFR